MKKVLLAMSGGIDSAAAAILLLEAGFQVIGATMLLSGSRSYQGQSGCFGPGEARSQADLQRVCEHLKIPLHPLNLAADFDRLILDYYRQSYLAGTTPNPCVVCNSALKFGLLPFQLRALGVEHDFFATGHYARLETDSDTGRVRLFKAADPRKDQSYFLCLLTQNQLQNTLLPLGKIPKTQVREIVSQSGLNFLLDKAESQDFVNESYHPLLFENDDEQPGELIGPNGEKLGTHRGLSRYTIGQRRHIGISGKPEPWYVTALDHRQNTVRVGPREGLFSHSLIAHSVNWVSIPAISAETRAQTKIRLAHEPAPSTLIPLSEGRVKVLFEQAQMSITPGQFAVFYDGDMLLGGGVVGLHAD